MRMGTFDSHRGLPFANVRTDITVNNNGRHGGDASAGPLFGARFTHWNIRVTNSRAGLVRIDGLAPYSATVGIDEVRSSTRSTSPISRATCTRAWNCTAALMRSGRRTCTRRSASCSARRWTMSPPFSCPSPRPAPEHGGHRAVRSPA